jgi:hypothetical protein
LLPFRSEQIRIHKTIILPVVLYEGETWFLSLREEHKMGMFVGRVLRRILGSRTHEVKGGWRKLHNKELHNLCSSPSIIRMFKSRSIRWRGHVAQMGEERNAYKILVGKPEEKRPLRKPRHSCMYNIKLDLGVIGWAGLDRDHLAQHRDQ